MSFNPLIPVITDPILQSSAQLRNNFKAINEAFSDNHVGLTSNDEFSGMHRVLTLNAQSGDPTTAVNETAIYNKLVSSIPALFYAPSNAQTPIQMTYPSIKTDSSNMQYSFIAGPFIVYGGLISNPTNGQTVVLTPGSSLKYVGLVTANAKNISPTTNTMKIPTNITGTSFDITFAPIGGATADVYYFAIGV